MTNCYFEISLIIDASWMHCRCSKFSIYDLVAFVLMQNELSLACVSSSFIIYATSDFLIHEADVSLKSSKLLPACSSGQPKSVSLFSGRCAELKLARLSDLNMSQSATTAKGSLEVKRGSNMAEAAVLEQPNGKKCGWYTNCDGENQLEIAKYAFSALQGGRKDHGASQKVQQKCDVVVMSWC